MNQARGRGFTIVELLIVIAIIVIVALVAKPNINQASPRAKCARIRHDMRVIAAGLEAYYADQRRYPTTCPLSRYAVCEPGSLVESRADLMPAAEAGQPPPGPAGLTTPVAHVTAMFPDPYSPFRGMPFTYCCTATNWIMTSPGPDCVYDIMPQAMLNADPATSMTRLLVLTYDPTNGIVSRGDIWRIKQ